MEKLIEKKKLRGLLSEGVFDGKAAVCITRHDEANKPSKWSSVLGGTVVKVDEMKRWNHGFKYRLDQLIGQYLLQLNVSPNFLL